MLIIWQYNVCNLCANTRENIILYVLYIQNRPRPTERRKEYAKIQLYLALIEAQKLGINKVMVNCVNTIMGSAKTILSLGGDFDREVYENKKM